MSRPYRHVGSGRRPPRSTRCDRRAQGSHRRRPSNADALNLMGYSLRKSGDTDRALEIFKKAVELAPPAAEVRLNYARLLVKTGRKPEAKRQLEELAKCFKNLKQLYKFDELMSLSNLLED